QGFPPSLSISNTNSLAEAIQQEFTDSKVVKSLNTMNCDLMMNPDKIKGDHSVFLSGNEENAKAKVKGLLQEIGWKEENVYDLGDISTARGTEMMLPIWLRLYAVLGHSNFNFHLAM
ncbi:MAG: NADP oxidoreductase, partial [Bacteroidota bacterium]